ncbi:tetratricopeptide repeat protein [Anabaena lutea]|uniref:Tetratricopeptide repeat protein n=1 Tax=Anabaena lutea FACHB-196 TaxID=2692881 RepID=A0ABR8F8Q6_9NOST|nr:tetratricopeptide repeat protein [Anabaena lutea]MBD2566568.1 tetratricopeptide repeat protein [Anabaena lutea FACHB-196]
MDWTTPLKAQQTDFIQRLKSSDFLHCDKQGQHSELTVISGERLKQLRDFCWEMVRKYKPNDPKNYFINNMKGKLGEEVVKTRLGNFVTEVDYEKRVGGDGKVDFTLASDPEVGIQVKARNGKFDEIKWTISQEEIEKNAVLVCILIQEEVSEAQNEYNLILAGFLPTKMITSIDGKALVGIDELLYSGGLRCYLKSLASSEADEYMRLGNECRDREDYRGAVNYYSQVLQLQPNNVDAYNQRGRAMYYLGDTQGGIEDFNQAIRINPNYAHSYYRRGVVRSELGDKQSAIEDYTQAIKIDPNFAYAYYVRGIAHSKLGDRQSAIEDYTQTIKIDPNFAYAYYKRGVARNELGDKQRAIEDYTQAIKIDPNSTDAYYNRGIARYQLGDKQNAIEDYTQAININPNFAYAYYARGIARYQLGDKQRAIEDYTQAININPNFALAYNNRGIARSNLGNKQSAIHDFQKAADIYKREGKEKNYQDAMERIRKLRQ